jgi:hypothetical protein
MCDDVQLCDRCVREFLILTRTWFAFDLPSKIGCDTSHHHRVCRRWTPGNWLNVQGFMEFGKLRAMVQDKGRLPLPPPQPPRSPCCRRRPPRPSRLPTQLRRAAGSTLLPHTSGTRILICVHYVSLMRN